MRRPVKKKAIITPDRVYHSVKVSKFINCLMWDGRKNAARGVVYGAFDIIKEKDPKTDPLEVFETAIRNAGPSVEVRSRRVGGANYQVPREVRPERRQALAMRWIIEASRIRTGSVKNKLADELLAASKNEGEAVKKRENVHKMAEANKAFAHFAW
jgi:small subunit ribosomal protein S7